MTVVPFGKRESLVANRKITHPPQEPGKGGGNSKGKDRDKKVEKCNCSKFEKPAHRHKCHVRR